jgi:Flp pilus assembly protein TadD
VRSAGAGKAEVRFGRPPADTGGEGGSVPSPSRASSPLRVLLLTPRPEELRAASSALQREGIEATGAGDVAAAVAALGRGGFDVAIVSHPLPDADVIGSCARLSELPGAPPLLLLDALDPNAQTFPAAVRPTRMLQKPVDPAKLAELVREVAAEPEPAVAADPDGSPAALGAALLQLAAARETGVLEVSSDAVRTRIFLQAGSAVSAEGGSLRETLGRMLLRRGALAESDYVRVIERMTERVMANEHQRMGEVLVELGLLSSQEVHEALAAQVLEKVIACFQWPSVRWSFSELDTLPEGLSPFALPPMEQLVHVGLRERAAPERVAAWLAPHASAHARLARPAAALQELLQLDPGAMRQLERIDGTRTLGALAQEGAAQGALLATLLLIGALELGTESRAAPAERARSRVPFARVVVSRRAAPPAASAPAARPTAAQSRLEAEQCFRQGQQLLAADRVADAAKLLRRAVSLEPGEPEYAMLEAWASYLEARQSLRVGRARAVGAARKLLEADPKAARAHSILGRLAMEDGDRERAIREFEVALLQDPEDADAKRGLKQLRG